jgi:hypothetical protein
MVSITCSDWAYFNSDFWISVPAQVNQLLRERLVHSAVKTILISKIQ